MSSAYCSLNNKSFSHDEALDLRIVQKQPGLTTSSISLRSRAAVKPSHHKSSSHKSLKSEGKRSMCSTGSDGNSKIRLQHRHKSNVFLKHKIKSRYLLHRDRKKNSDSGAFCSLQGSLSSYRKTSTTDTPSPNSHNYSSSLASSSSVGGSENGSLVNLAGRSTYVRVDEQQQQSCMIMRQAVPLVLMVQDEVQNASPNNNNNNQQAGSILFLCNLCQMSSANVSEVLLHFRQLHSDMQYCFFCSKFHDNKAQLDSHKSVCAMAHRGFQNIMDGHYMEHYKQKNSSQEAPLNLSVASDVALRAAQIIQNRHGRRNKMKNLVKCTYCRKAFFGRFYLQRHLRSHTTRKLCKCQICGRGFSVWNNLRSHMNQCHASSPDCGHTTPESPNMSSSPSEVRKPIYTAIPDVDNSPDNENIPTSNLTSFRRPPTNWSKPLVRDWLDQSNPSQQVPSNQTEFSESEHPPAVSQNQSMSEIKCLPAASQKSRSDNSEKNVLLVSAAGENSIPNQPAANLGVTSSRLEIREDTVGLQGSLCPVVTPDGSRSFICNLCDKQFRTKFGMQRHLDFHADKRPYQCDQCDYRAKTKPQLKVHVMRHSGQKCYHCSICNYSCVTHSDLNRHCKSKSHVLRVSVINGQEASVSTTTECVPADV